MKGVKTISCSVILMLGLGQAPAPAQAQSGHFLAGGEASARDFYTYVGAVLPLPGNRLGQGFVQRYWLDYFGYEFQGAPGEVRARAWGAEALVGYQTSSQRNWGSLYVGVRYTDTTLTPADPGADVSGSAFGVKVLAEGETWLDERWRVNGIASYAFAQSGYWVRGRALRTLPNRLHLGPEVVLAGNPDYDTQRYGLVLGGFRALGGSLDVKGGYSTGSSGSSGYGGIEFFRPF